MFFQSLFNLGILYYLFIETFFPNVGYILKIEIVEMTSKINLSSLGMALFDRLCMTSYEYQLDFLPRP